MEDVPIIFLVLKAASKNPYVRGPMMIPIGPRTKTGAAKATRVTAGWIAALLLASFGLITKSGARLRRIIPRKNKSSCCKIVLYEDVVKGKETIDRACSDNRQKSHYEGHNSPYKRVRYSKVQ